MKKKTTESIGSRYTHESRARKGIETVCPICGSWTKRDSGFCRSCEAKEGLR